MKTIDAMQARLTTELRRVGRLLGFGAITAGTTTALIAHEALTDARGHGGLRDTWVRTWASAVIDLFGLEVDVHGTIDIPPGRGALIVSNHLSTFDSPLLLRVFGGQLVARGDMADWPLMGRAAKRTGTIFVDRTNAVSGAATMRAVRLKLLAKERVGIFPEGTTFDDGTVHPFQPGAFVAAHGTDARIVPVGIAYQRGSGMTFPDESLKEHALRVTAAPPSRVTMVIGESLNVPKDAKSRAVAEQAHAAVSELARTARTFVERR